MKAALLLAALLTLAGPALAQTPPGPVNLPAVGRCVWDKLTPDQRAPMVAAAESNDTDASYKAVNRLTSVAWYRLIDQCDTRAVDEAHALDMIAAMAIQEAEAELIKRDAGLVREDMDAAIAAAPAETGAALQQAVRDRRAHKTPATAQLITLVTPIATALKLPDPAGFLKTPPGLRFISYCMDYYQTRIISAEGAPPP